MDLAIGTYSTSASSTGPTTEPFKGACLLHQRLHRQKQLLHQLDQPYHLNQLTQLLVLVVLVVLLDKLRWMLLV
uniref:Uncharacterized protein n=1 Tax=Picea glauca TaxID=3330 RepID=A0A101LUV4_PICGL|nr:hypothetical protein ABT39_MTgene2302 [Picea glauca]